MVAWLLKLFRVMLPLLLVGRLFAAENPTVKIVGIDNGLSNNSVICVYKDYKGFMWFGTYDGLNRYDGYKFTIFSNRIGDSTSLGCNEIYSIAGDNRHNLYIGTRKGASRYNPGKNNFSPVSYLPYGQTKQRYVTGSISNIIADPQGRVYIPSDKDGLVVVEPNEHSGLQAPLQANQGLTTHFRISVIAYNKQSKGLWLIVQNIGLCRYDVNTKIISLVNPAITQGNCITADDKGNLWFGDDKGLYRYTIASNQVSGNYVDVDCKISCISIDKKGDVWVGSDGRGIFVITPGAQKAFPYLSPGGKPVINSVAVYSIFEDADARKWIGTLRGGINIIEAASNPFKTFFYGDENTLNANNNFIQAFSEDEQQNLWIGTGGGGLRYWDRRRNVFTNYTHHPDKKNSVGGNFITGILKDGQNNIWVSSWFGGISRFNKATGSFVRYPCYNPYTKTGENRAWFVYEDRQKRLWCSTSNDGTLYQLNKAADRFELFDSSLTNFQCMAEDKAGNLWGGNYAALILVDPINKKHRRYQVGYTVRAIHEDKNGNLWVGTQGGGLLRFDPKTGHYQRFDATTGLRGNTVLRILEDKNGNLWMSTFTGLVHMNVKERKFRFFSHSDGLQSNQFNFNAALALQSGEFLFGGLKGFNSFHPDSVGAKGSFPPVYIKDIRIEGVPLESNSTFITKRSLENINAIQLPYDSATLSVDFVALEFSFPDKIQYAYYLEGWDKKWNYTGQASTASYNQVREGSYLLRVKSTNAEGVWNKEETVLQVTVLPPWYRTWWAYVLSILVAGLLVYLYVRYQARQTRLEYEVKLAHREAEKEKELTEKKISFFTHVSHEFRTPLTLILNPLKEMAGTGNTGSGKGIEMIYRNAKRLLSLADQLLLFRKVESIDEQMRIERLDLAALCHDVYLSFSQHALSKEVVFEISGIDAELPVYVDKEKIEIILFNLVSNAFKYTPNKGKIEINLVESVGFVNLFVKDNGTGIPEQVGDRLFESFYQINNAAKQVPTGFGIGLYVSQKLAQAHSGKLSYSSKVGEGTVFSLMLLKGKEHFGDRYVSEDHTEAGSIFNELMGQNVESPLPANVEGDMVKGGVLDSLTSDLPTMLVVDDNEEMRRYIKNIFSSNFTIYEADDGVSGYDAVKLHVPDIVISDVMMKVMSGVELCRQIKSNPTLAHIPVVLLTASSSETVHLQGIEVGAEDYITKPFDNELIVARIKNILKGRTHLHQFYYNAITLKPNVHLAGEHKIFFEKCIQIVEAHLSDPDFTIPVFCREIGMSHPALYKKVKAVSGQTVNVFIRHLRLRKAAELLINTHKTITEVTYITGFNDIKYFREQFQKLFDINPSEYIKRYRKVLGKTTEEI